MYWCMSYEALLWKLHWTKFLISIVSKKEKTQNGSTGAGRPCNPVFDFASGHPLHGELHQMLRSKHLVPILAGTPPPRYPKAKKHTRAWEKQAHGRQNLAAHRTAITQGFRMLPWHGDCDDAGSACFQGPGLG